MAVGNGTASRETEAFAPQGGRRRRGLDKVVVAIVPETGASVYSASAVAREELPQLDVSLRGAVSIARRLQDPLAELVKIEPRSLGVGQYQHDVDQKSLERELDTAVEGAVNRVGVELNTASAPLLRRVSGLSERLARAHRRTTATPTARSASRKALLQGRRLRPQDLRARPPASSACAAARTRSTRTAVHPERYPVVEKMAEELAVPLGDLVGNPDAGRAARLQPLRRRGAGARPLHPGGHPHRAAAARAATRGRSSRPPSGGRT